MAVAGPGDVVSQALERLEVVCDTYLSVSTPVQLAAAFEKLIHDEALRKRLGAAGREWASRNCWKESAEALFNPHWVAA